MPPKKIVKTKEEKPEIGVEFGSVGTDIFGGYLDVDLNSKWRDLLTRVDLIQDMMDQDGTIIGMLRATKDPILSAKFKITPATEEEKDQKNADFIDECLFDNINFQSFLIEALTYFEQGFSLFEKNFVIIDGKVKWKSFAFREQKSIDKWAIDGQDWIDGHPPGITQNISSTDEDKTTTYNPSIPWNKLLRFTKDQIGNNYEGKSILRSVYLHYYMKNLMYKISSISAERFGVGIPYAKYKSTVSAKNKAKIDNLLKNIRANEQAFFSYGEADIEEWGMKTPEGGSSQNTLIEKIIDHHDKKEYDSILAGFLNLTNGEGGSNALSKDQSSFFLRGLQKEADYICGILNEAIKELCFLNSMDTSNGYPKLECSEIGQISLDEFTTSISTAKNSGLLGKWSEKDVNKTRNQLKLDPMEELEGDEKLDDFTTKIVAPAPKFSGQWNYSEKKNLELAETKKRPTQRERTFQKNISDFENYLASEFNNIENIAEQEEQKLDKKVISVYKTLDTERIDGVQKISQSKANIDKFKGLSGEVKKTQKTLERKFINSPIQNRLFSHAKSMAEKTVREDEKLLQEQEKKFATFVVNENQFKSFVNGYTSNMGGVLFNEPRRYDEMLQLHIGSGVALDLAMNEVKQKTFNRNILALSSITHPRGAYNGILKDANEQRNVNNFKVVVPKKEIKNLNPSGMTSSLLFRIFTAAALLETVNKKTEGKNPDALSGLNLHHGASVYYYPISDQVLTEEEEIAKQQRTEYLENIE